MMTHKPYSDEFKQEAVKLVADQGMTQRQVASDLGIDHQTLRRWLAVQRASDAATPEPTTTTELVRLRRENDQLRMERDILKKAVGIFSRMPQ